MSVMSQTDFMDILAALQFHPPDEYSHDKASKEYEVTVKLFLQ